MVISIPGGPAGSRARGFGLAAVKRINGLFLGWVCWESFEVDLVRVGSFVLWL